MELVNRQRYLLEQIAKLIDMSKSLVFVDAGCGTGNMLKAVKSHIPNWSVYGFDLDPALCLESKEADDRVSVCNASLLQIPYPTKFADIVICSEVLEHLKEEDHKKACSELYRIAKTDGLIVITTPAVHWGAGHMQKKNHFSYLDASLLSSLFPNCSVMKEALIAKKDPNDPTLVIIFRKN